MAQNYVAQTIDDETKTLSEAYGAKDAQWHTMDRHANAL